MSCELRRLPGNVCRHLFLLTIFPAFPIFRRIPRPLMVFNGLQLVPSPSCFHFLLSPVLSSRPHWRIAFSTISHFPVCRSMFLPKDNISYLSFFLLCDLLRRSVLQWNLAFLAFSFSRAALSGARLFVFLLEITTSFVFSQTLSFLYPLGAAPLSRFPFLFPFADWG